MPNQPTGKPFIWSNGPLTGLRIKVRRSSSAILISRQWHQSKPNAEWDVCDTDLLGGLTGTIGPLCTLNQANASLYPLPGVQGLRTGNPMSEEHQTGDEYLVIWDRRPDDQTSVIDSLFEGEIRAFTKVVCTVRSWEEERADA